MGSNSFGMALVAGKNLVPKPATGKTALRSLVMENTQKLKGWLDARYIKNSRSSIALLPEKCSPPAYFIVFQFLVRC